MTYSKLGLTSRRLREEIAARIFEPAGIQVDEVLGDAELAAKAEASISAKGWTIYDGGRDSMVCTTQDGPFPETRDEIIDQAAASARHSWSRDVGGIMRRRALAAAGVEDGHHRPAWTIMISGVVAAVGAAAGITARRLALMERPNSRIDGRPFDFAALQDDEQLPDTPWYRRTRDTRKDGDYLKGGLETGSPWIVRHALQLLEDEGFPVRSVSLQGPATQTIIEIRGRLSDTQMQGVVGLPLGAVVGCRGLEQGTPPGDAPIVKAERSGLDARTTLMVANTWIPAAAAPDGIDHRWSRLPY